jgi:MFS family permease
MAIKINFSTLQAALPLFGEQVLGVEMGRVSLLFVVTALAYGLVQPIAGRLADRRASAPLIAMTFLAMAPLLAWLGLQQGYGAFLAIYAGFSLLQSAGVLFAMKHLGDAIGEGAQGRSFGLASAIGDVGMIVAPSLLMPLYAWHPAALFAGLGGLVLCFLGGFWALGRAGRRPAIGAEHA